MTRARIIHLISLFESFPDLHCYLITEEPKGGFQLSKAPDKVPVRAVIEAIQGPLRLNRCLLGDGMCDRQDVCPIREKMGLLQDQMDAYLTSVTLGELARTRTAVRKRKKRRRRQS